MTTQYIRYNPQTDPKQYLAEALRVGGAGFLANRQRQQFSKGLSPTMTPMQLFQKALQSGYGMNQSTQFARALTPTRQTGKPPWWTTGATPQQIGDYRDRITSGPDRTKRWNLKEINDTLDAYTHTKDRELVPLNKNDEKTLRVMMKGSGYGLKKIPGKKKKYFLGADWLAKDEDIDEWVITDEKGTPMKPPAPEDFAKSMAAQSAPDMRLDPVWAQLSDQQKQGVWENEELIRKALDKGHSPEAVIEALEEE